VLATRDTLTSFAKSEVNLKRTFPKKAVAANKIEVTSPQAAAVNPAGTAAAQKTADVKTGITLPSLPKLPEKTPESLVPSSGAGGTIRQHQKSATGGE
jgi:hypothetical protein